MKLLDLISLSLFILLIQKKCEINKKMINSFRILAKCYTGNKLTARADTYKYI